jgi:hypothetical protein
MKAPVPAAGQGEAEVLVQLCSKAINLWADVRTRTSQEEGVTALDFGLLVGLALITIVVALSLAGGKHAMPLNELNTNYP